ncbi:MAG: hypothetical protein OXI92_04220, partial [Acidobacteriota bacterium]|nr:hypothetical protein [Acidobacteriota bacterium]
LHVLKRYGIENYFPQRACEKVLQRDLNTYFPIPDNVPIREHFSERKSGQSDSFYQKSLNEQIAQCLQLDDIANTDLRLILDFIKDQAGALKS